MSKGTGICDTGRHLVGLDPVIRHGKKPDLLQRQFQEGVDSD